MASELYNTIDAISREKGIDPQIVVSAVEDAIVAATRKYYKSQENLRALLDKDTGKINAFAVKSVVESRDQIEDPNLQIAVEAGRRDRGRAAHSQSHRGNPRPHRRATGEAGDFPESSGGRTRYRL